jgi:DNA-binding transcriptional ArsR family regulator
MSPNVIAGADIFAVLGDARRRRILELLAVRERSVGALVAELAISQPSVTQHLAALRDVGLVTSEKRGTSSIYSLVREPLAGVTRWVESLGSQTPEVGGADDPQSARLIQ